MKNQVIKQVPSKWLVRFSFAWVIIFTLFSVVSGQDPISNQQVQEEILKRGLSENEIRLALKKEGLILEQLNPDNPADILKIQQAIESLERQKNTDLSPLAAIDTFATPQVFIPGLDSDSLKQDSFLVEISTEDQLYGHEFINSSVEKKGDLIIVNESYILGAGDIISVSIWSDNAIFDKSYTVSKEGYIKLDESSQRIFLKGLSFAEARKKIKARFARFYRFSEGDYNISLESARSLRVSIYGEVMTPGAYSFSATYNVVDGLRLTGGLKANASIRNIRIIRSNGKTETFDLYSYIMDDMHGQSIFLMDGDIIHVPIARNIVQIEGAIRRAARYESLENEIVSDMITFAGGFSENANTRLVQVERFTLGEKQVIDIDLSSTEDKAFSLKNGDIIHIREIAEEAANFVMVEGEVINPGRFQRTDQMRVADLLELAGLKASSKTDFAFLIRKKLDGTSTYIRLNLNHVLSNINHGDNLILANRDQLTVWSKERFIDDGTISVEGAIRFPGTYQYDFSEELYLSDALILAGGLSRDASQIAVIHRSDPLKPNEKEYVRINLEKLDTSYLSHENIVLEPFDRIEILSKNLFTERTMVRISGPVNHPGEFQYGKDMKLKDLIILSGGFKLGASTKNIEISRVEIEENVPTRVTIAKVDFDPDLNKMNDIGHNYSLEPYDHVKVRYVPEFEFQNDVEIKGEVSYPGIYTLASKNERVSDLIKKAGGLTDEAFAEGASLYRQEDSMGYIVLKLQEAMSAQGSRYNFILKDGDVLEIPKIRDFVTIQGATKANEIYSEKMLKNPNGINVPYHSSKNALFYIKKYTGGIADNGSWKEVYVEHPNGEIEKTRNFLFFRDYPEARKGSVIRVGLKPELSREKEEKKEVDWSKVISDTLAQAMTIITLILLAKQASN